MDLRPVPSPFMTLKKVTNFWISLFSSSTKCDKQHCFFAISQDFERVKWLELYFEKHKRKMQIQDNVILKVQRSFIYRSFFSCLEKEINSFFFLRMWSEALSFLEDTKQQNNSFIFSADTNSFDFQIQLSQIRYINFMITFKIEIKYLLQWFFCFVLF